MNFQAHAGHSLDGESRYEITRGVRAPAFGSRGEPNRPGRGHAALATLVILVAELGAELLAVDRRQYDNPYCCIVQRVAWYGL